MAPAPSDDELLATPIPEGATTYENTHSVIVPKPLEEVFAIFTSKEHQERVLLAVLAAIWPSDFEFTKEDYVDPVENFTAPDTTFKGKPARSEAEGGLKRQYYRCKGYRGLGHLVGTQVADPVTHSVIEETVSYPNIVLTRKMRTMTEETDEQGNKVTKITEELDSKGVANRAIRWIVKAEVNRQQRAYMAKFPSLVQ